MTPVVRIVALVVLLAIVGAPGFSPVAGAVQFSMSDVGRGFSPAERAGPEGPAYTGSEQSDLDQFMEEVLAKRDENWKKLQQYILEEDEKVQVRNPVGMPVWGQKREYQWFIREGYFIRSPLTADGVKVPEDERRKVEDGYLKRAKAIDQRTAEQAAKEGGGGDPAAASDPAPIKSVEALLTQTRQPQFMDSAYFLKFKFEKGKYALVGREKLEGHDVLRIEYYPAKLFTNDPPKDAAKAAEQKKRKQSDYGAKIEHLMNKNSLVTIWVEPKAKQIVKYTFDNVQLDFFPASWLFRLEDMKASMVMSQPFKDVWLPRDVEMYFAVMLAIGVIDVRFNLEYHDYKEAATAARIKGRGGRP